MSSYSEDLARDLEDPEFRAAYFAELAALHEPVLNRLATESNCRTGCPTQDHESWGACARAANFSTLVGDVVDANRRLERNLAEYRAVRKQGIQPQSIRRPFVEAAKKANDL